MACDPDALIAAINLANAGSGATLNLANNCTYTLTANSAAGGDGLPIIRQPITINGNNATITRAALTNVAFRIFDVGTGGNLYLQNLTVTGGRTPTTASAAGGGILVQESGVARLSHVTVKNNASTALGGGIASFGFVDLTDSAITDNNATDAGGGVFSQGSLSLSNSALTGNLAARGGALFNAGSAFIENATMSHNGAATSGGAIFADTVAAATRVVHSVITDNAAAAGGGAFVLSSLSLSDTNVSDNAASTNGGGIFNAGSLVVDNGKIDDNKARVLGGGLFNDGGTAVLRHTEVNDNTVVSATSQGGGIYNNGGTVSLIGSRVVNNTSALAPGGIFSTNPALVTVDQQSVVFANRPTNCTPGIVNCFG